MIEYRSFTGGIFETNCYALEAPEGWILFDAPDTACDWLVQQGIELRLLLLTMLSDREFFRNFGFQFEIEPVTPDLLIEATPSRAFLGMNFEILEVPGHCPGSLCFFSRENELLIGGDVLFAGGVGRWDLPGGDGDLLFAGIREKLYPLGDNVTVLPGHGPATSIGTERGANPFVRPL